MMIWAIAREHLGSSTTLCRFGNYYRELLEVRLSMADTIKIPDHIETIINSTSLEDLERLVKGIDHKQITELVKHNKHLQQQVFPGFRPTNLPWDRVPTKLSRDAQNHPEAIRALLKLWQISNSDLSERVKHEIHVESIEDDVARLLASLEHHGKDRLIWALLLDEREEIQSALTSGLRNALISESSTLMARAERYRLASQLEKANQEIGNLKDQLSKLEDRNRLLNHKAGQVDDLQNKAQKLEEEREQQKQKEAQFEKEIRQLTATLQGEKSERDTLQNTVEQLQVLLDQERTRNKDLQASFDVAIASQDESGSEVKQRLDETLKLLEGQRGENASLQQKLNKAERDKVTAYEKRDEEWGRREHVETRLKKLEIDKNVLIKQRREEHKKLDQLTEEFYQACQMLAAKEEEQKSLLLLSELDEPWNRTIEILANHLTLSLPDQETVNRSVQFDEKWANWQAWQQLESTWVRSILGIPVSASIEDLANAERAQKLLALRWYLLECLKLSLTEMLHANNRVIKEIK